MPSHLPEWKCQLAPCLCGTAAGLYMVPHHARSPDGDAALECSAARCCIVVFVRRMTIASRAQFGVGLFWSRRPPAPRRSPDPVYNMSRCLQKEFQGEVCTKKESQKGYRSQRNRSTERRAEGAEAAVRDGRVPERQIGRQTASLFLRPVFTSLHDNVVPRRAKFCMQPHVVACANCWEANALSTI